MKITEIIPLHWPRWVWPVVVGTVVVIVLLGLVIGVRIAAAGKFYPGVAVGGVELHGKTYAAGHDELQRVVDELNRNGFVFSFNQRQVVLTPHVSSPTDPDLEYDIVTFNLKQTLDTAYAVGRKESWYKQLSDEFCGLAGSVKVPFAAVVDTERLTGALRDNFGAIETPGQEQKLHINLGTTPPLVTIDPAITGLGFDYPAVAAQLQTQLATLTTGRIQLQLVKQNPVTLSNPRTAAQLQPLVNGILSRAPLTLTFAEQAWPIDRDTLAGLLSLQIVDRTAVLALDPELFTAYLDKTVALEVEQPVAEPRFTMNNGRVTEFQVAQAGQRIDHQATRAAIDEQFIHGTASAVSLAVVTVNPTAATADVNTLGITELLGVGKSNFSGSPKNRRHNIAVGAQALNGVLVPPGEEFSLLTTLGEVDGEHGYLTELVIKGNRTVPEYGGGLCQIGTTVFRATLDSALPVTVRQNHSYTVTYYAPWGTDATIYDPAPDYRFLNDTGHYILIQTKVIGDELRFEFWGTKDGRTVRYTDATTHADFYEVKPRTANWISPPPAKYVETLDLPVGQKKCTEKPHSGVTAEFDYAIKYPDGKEKKRTFTSVYRPWQEVCLVGVEELSAPPEEEGTDTATTPTDGSIPTDSAAPVPTPVPAG